MFCIFYPHEANLRESLQSRKLWLQFGGRLLLDCIPQMDEYRETEEYVVQDMVMSVYTDMYTDYDSQLEAYEQCRGAQWVHYWRRQKPLTWDRYMAWRWFWNEEWKAMHHTMLSIVRV